MADWLRLSLSVAPAGLETLTAELWTLGTTGIEERSIGDVIRVEAFFALASPPPAAATRIGGRFWSRLQVSLDQVATLSDQDWTASYRQRVQPFTVGRRFRIDPREPFDEPEAEADQRVLIRLPARQAFGIGSHESTQLVIEWLEDLEVDGFRVLDVGTGTGILGFVALHCGASSVVAVEIDKTAVVAAVSNQRLNGVYFPLVAGSVRALDVDARFDLALVNVLPENIEGDLPQIRDLIRPRGRAIFSGVLSQSSAKYREKLDDLGLAIARRRVAGEWEAWMTEEVSR